MQFIPARDAKYSFSKFIDMALAEPVAMERHGRATLAALSVENYEQLYLGIRSSAPHCSTDTGRPTGADDKGRRRS